MRFGDVERVRVSNLRARRQAIRHLLRERDPVDAMEAYYAFHHPDAKTTLIPWPEGVENHAGGRAAGYVALSRTGIDLFRPLITMRLPIDHASSGNDSDTTQAAADLLQLAITPDWPVILDVPARYRPIVDALFEIHSEEKLRLYVLDLEQFEPIINVLVTRSNDLSRLPRYTIRSSQRGIDEVVAGASLNWQSPYFAEIAVNTLSQYRRKGWGRSVVSALCNHVIESGRTPLYVVAEENGPSIHLAESLGFVDTGARDLLIQATRKSRA